MISKKHQYVTFVVWLLLVPPAVYWAYTSFPSVEANPFHLFLMFITLLVTMLAPLRFETMTVSMERWATFALFFQYGVFTELVFTQIALLFLLVIRKTDVPVLYRFCVNSTTFVLVSVISAFVFHQVGGTIGSFDFLMILFAGSLYAITYTTVNSLVLYVYLFFEPGPTFIHTNWQYVIWDFIITMAIFPLSIALYFLYEEFQHKALMLMAIPFLIILLIAKMYNQSDRLSVKLKSASNIGHELANHLNRESVAKMFITKLKDVVSYENAYILDLLDNEHIGMIIGTELNEFVLQTTKMTFHPMKTINNGLSITDSQVFSKPKELTSLRYFTFDHSIKSAMTVPIKRKDRTEGFLILTSSKRNQFHSLDVKIVELLSGYFAASFVKARLYEKTIEQTERCGLTGLFNFRYLESKVEEEIIRFHTGEIGSLSLCILDLDFFKQINDTYGHQSGNDILISFARLLQTFEKEGITLARYGGEEFVFLFPNKTKDEAVAIAQQIRSELESTNFRIVPDLAERNEPIDIQVTVSIGVATVPEDAQSSRTLLRNADQALYIGGKRAGRNRVGIYGGKRIQTVQ